MKKLIVFTDLDGTLLDHYDYSWQDAKPALDQLQHHNCPIIINSSKTRSEIEWLRNAMGNTDPFIVENGSAVFIPDQYFAAQSGDLTIKRFGPPREEILEILARLRAEYNYEFIGFNDMSADQVAEVTGLNLEDAAKAKERDATEPLLWNDTEIRLHAFISRLEASGYTVVSGGRFYHVMGTVSKADSIAWLMNAYQNQYPDHELLSVGLGDSNNDVPMLEAVDIPVLVAGVHGKKIHVKRNELIRTTALGPKGWNQAMQELIAEYL